MGDCTLLIRAGPHELVVARRRSSGAPPGSGPRSPWAPGPPTLHPCTTTSAAYRGDTITSKTSIRPRLLVPAWRPRSRWFWPPAAPRPPRRRRAGPHRRVTHRRLRRARRRAARPPQPRSCLPPWPSSRPPSTLRRASSRRRMRQSLRQLAKLAKSSAQLGAATGTFTPGTRRLAFGLTANSGAFIYAPTAIYIATTPDTPARGPFLAPADPMSVSPQYRSQQNSGPGRDPGDLLDPACRSPHKGTYTMLALTRTRQGLIGAPGEIAVAPSSPIPDVGQRPPDIATDTAGHGQRQHRPAHHAAPAGGHALGLLQPGARQAPDRAPVLDPAVLHLEESADRSPTSLFSCSRSSGTGSPSSTRRST